MWPHHPEGTRRFADLPLIEGNDVKIPAVTHEHQTHLTTWYTEHAVDFIDRRHDRPFFLYVAHSMPHVPLHVSDKYAGQTENGLFGDVIMEIDWSVGEILAALQRHGIDEKTLVIFSSDNGPWLSYGNHAGSAGPLREGKGTAFEGGVREPCLMRWPGQIPAGSVCNELAATIDILPTMARLTGGRLPDHAIDGQDIWPLMSGADGARTPHEVYYYYYGNELQAIRSGDWKLQFPHRYRSLTGKPGRDGMPDGYTQEQLELSLFNLRDDIGETTDVQEAHPDVVARLQHLAEAARAELGDSARKRAGTGYRAPTRLDE